MAVNVLTIKLLVKVQFLPQGKRIPSSDEIITVCFEDYRKHANAVCGQNPEFLTCCYQTAFTRERVSSAFPCHCHCSFLWHLSQEITENIRVKNKLNYVI